VDEFFGPATVGGGARHAVPEMVVEQSQAHTLQCLGDGCELGEHIDAVGVGLDLALQAVIENLKLTGLAEISPRFRQRILFDRAVNAKDLGVMLVLDENGDFGTRCNMQMVELGGFEDAAEEESVRQLIQRHAEYTKCQRAWKVLALWDEMVPKFVKVMPKDYKRVLESLKKVEQLGLSGEDVIMSSFEENSRDVARIGGG